MSRFFSIHVRTLQGLEAVLAEELKQLGAKDLQIANRVVLCRGDTALLYKANLWCRTAIRVLKPLFEFSANDEKAFYKKIHDFDWSPWVAATGTLALDAEVHSSFTSHSLFLAQLAKDAIVDQFRERTGRRPSVDLERPDLRLVIGLHDNTAHVFADASGDSLHKRGYRKRGGAAPLNETLAAGIVALSGWEDGPLLDPMCGSGTLLIEAALKARNMAPGLLRNQFGFQKWADYDASLYQTLVAQAQAAIRTTPLPMLTGFDQDPATVEIARENIRRAGLERFIQIEPGDFFSKPAPAAAGTLLMNPPYGERLEVDDAIAFYQRIGDRLKGAYGGWSAFVFTGNLDAARFIGLRSSRRDILNNGAIECRLLKYEIRAKTSDSAIARRPLPEQNAQYRASAEAFTNRLRKTFKREAKWAERESIGCWRLYDRDIPELPFRVEFYQDKLVVSETPRNHDRSPLEHQSYLRWMAQKAAETLGVFPENLLLRQRRTKTPSGLRSDEDRPWAQASEGQRRFWIRYSTTEDLGLVLEHRQLRTWVQKHSKGLDCLSLFSHTGAFTVAAGLGGARSTTSIDSASHYLEWTRKNLDLNHLTTPNHVLYRADALEFLEQTQSSFDLIVVDPPAHTTQRSTGELFDLQRDQNRLFELLHRRLRPGGKICFLTDYRRFELLQTSAEEITPQVLPPDCKRHSSLRCWVLRGPGAS